MKKKLIIMLSSIMLVSLLIVGGTMAWFTDEKTVDNKFTAGTVKIEINEHGFEDITNWNPGDTTDKKVSIKSLGSKKSYIRVALTPEWIDTDLPTSNVQLNINTTDWVYENGWYYYKNIVNENQETELLLNSVTLVGSATGNEYQGKTLKINVKAEAVQASNNAYQTTWGLTALPSGVEAFPAS